jgi:maltooligosyltrehalose trehalohydrolase
LGRPLVLIPESDLNDPRIIWPCERGGFALDAQWSDDFHHALHSVLTGERGGYYADFGALADLATALGRAYVFEGRYSIYRRKTHGRPHGGLSGHSFLAYAQNHDQVGNRALGERLSQLVSPGRLKVAAALVLSSPFVPMLFQGEEWGASTPFLFFSDHSEPELARATREGRRAEFAALGWKPGDIADPQAEGTFRSCKLDWLELARQPHAGLLDWHRRLIGLRRNEPALRDGRLDCVRTRFDETAGWFVVERGPLSVVCNLAPARQRIPIRPGACALLLASNKSIETTDSGITLPPDSVAILRLTAEAAANLASQ